MSNSEIVTQFLEVLLRDPDLTMQAVALRLSATNYELRLLKADPCKSHYEEQERQQKVFPFVTGERGSSSIWQMND